MFEYFVIALGYVFIGLLAHFVAEQRGRPLWEAWLVTFIVAFKSMLAAHSIGMPLMALLLAPLPPVFMLFLRNRGTAALIARSAPCPHCEGPFVVDRRFMGQSVLCPHCQKPFQLPAA